MKVADFVVDFYAKKGIDTAFVVYGAANGDLIDAFTRIKNIKYVCTFHEQAAGFAAEGYAKIKRLPGLAISTSGPGATNMITSVANCYYDSIPCIFLSGQINANFLRPHKKIRQMGFQETDIVNIVKPICKYVVQVKDPKMIRYELEKSYHIATSGRAGPIFIDLPVNIQKAEIDPNQLDGFDTKNWNNKFDLLDIEKKILNFLQDLEKSQRPIFLVGGGVQMSNTSKEMSEIAKILQIPCFVTWNGIDVVTSDSDFYGGRVGTYGGPGRNFGVQNSDLLFGIGTRISGRLTGGNVKSFMRGAKKYVVDIDPYNLEKNYQQVRIDVNILSDLTIFFKIFKKVLKNRNVKKIIKLKKESRQKWINKVKFWKNKYNTFKKSFLKNDSYKFQNKNYTHPYAFLNILSKLAKNNDIFVGDCGGCSVLVGHALETKCGQRYHSNNGHAPMGFSFSAAIGSYIASNKKGNTICLTGDGGFNMNIQELQTLINYNLPIKTFIINNKIYGITKSFQKTNFEGREEACGPKGYIPPDFISVSNGYKIKTFKISNNSEIESTIRDVMKYDGPVVCEVDCTEFHSYEPKIIGWNTPVEDMYPYLPRKEFIKNLFIKPHESWKKPFMPYKKDHTME
jgi:acetolactate synthase-1/2/3 large subunit